MDQKANYSWTEDAKRQLKAVLGYESSVHVIGDLTENTGNSCMWSSGDKVLMYFDAPKQLCSASLFIGCMYWFSGMQCEKEGDKTICWHFNPNVQKLKKNEGRSWVTFVTQYLGSWGRRIMSSKLVWVTQKFCRQAWYSVSLGDLCFVEETL